MEARIEARLIEGLAALDRGEPLDLVLARFPEDADALRPLLTVASTLPDLALQARPEAQAASRRNFLAAAAAIPAPASGAASGAAAGSASVPTAGSAPTPASGDEGRAHDSGAAPLRPRAGWWSGAAGRGSGWSWLAAASAAAVFVLMLSQGSLPGDPLYPLKRGSERAALAAAPGVNAQATVQARLNGRRVSEVQELLATGRSAEVTMDGTIEAVLPNAWVLSGVKAEFQPQSRILGTPEEGEAARVWGRTENGRLLVDTISCEQPEGGFWESPPPIPTERP